MFCGMDIAEALTKSKNSRKYWNTIKTVVFQNLCKVQKWHKNLSGNRVCEPQVGLHALSAS